MSKKIPREYIFNGTIIRNKNLNILNKFKDKGKLKKKIKKRHSKEENGRSTTTKKQKSIFGNIKKKRNLRPKKAEGINLSILIRLNY